jgi:hypothetical protein
MSLRLRLAKLLLFGVLEIGAVMGVPMTPQKIEELLNIMNRIVVQRVVKKEGPPEPKLP